MLIFVPTDWNLHIRKETSVIWRIPLPPPSPFPPSSSWFISRLRVAILVINVAHVSPHRPESSTQNMSGDTRQLYDVIKMYLTAKGNSSNDRLIEMMFWLFSAHVQLYVGGGTARLIVLGATLCWQAASPDIMKFSWDSSWRWSQTF